ncbi:hypothetical protein EXS74_00640 [Candidatus Woesearchaeota archaeon]|nr:hypothetical protein [Candidatus Woesearchaeota archaeon]
MRKVTIPSHSVLALLDRELRMKGIQPVYIWNVYFDTVKRKTEAGILLHSFTGESFPFPTELHPFVGILGFINGKEPGEGTIPLHIAVPKEAETLSIAYIVEGIYKGDFSEAQVQKGKVLKEEKELLGLKLVHQYVVTEKDLEEKSYEISVIETRVISEES